LDFFTVIIGLFATNERLFSPAGAFRKGLRVVLRVVLRNVVPTGAAAEEIGGRWGPYNTRCADNGTALAICRKAFGVLTNIDVLLLGLVTGTKLLVAVCFGVLCRKLIGLNGLCTAASDCGADSSDDVEAKEARGEFPSTILLFVIPTAFSKGTVALDPLDAVDAVDAADDRRDCGLDEENVPKFSLRKEGWLAKINDDLVPVELPLFNNFVVLILRIDPQNNKQPLSR